MIEKKMLIGGKYVFAREGKVFDVLNPANETVVGTCPLASEEDIEDAVLAAEKGFSVWSKMNPFQRGEILRKASENVLEKAEEIARVMTSEQGKQFKEALGEVKKGAEILRFYAEEGERVYGKIIPNAEDGMESRVIYQPIGVSGAISPWNYPVELLAWKLAGALAAGCSIICKLPYETPLSPLMFAECVEAAGVPDGVLNVVTGRGSKLGPAMLKHKKIKKIAFTGSTEVGRGVLSESANTLKKISLELGGSLPMIVCADCDLKKAVSGTVRRSFRNMGQICIAINRVYVERSIYEEYLSKLTEATKKLTIGNGSEGEFDLGPMCTKSGVEKVSEHVEDARKKGARILTGGKAPEGEQYRKGFFYEPTLIADASHDMLIMSEETFGPAIGIMPFDTLDEAISLANDSPYGLASILYSSNFFTIERVLREVNAGNIAVNNVDAGVVNAPYGGWNDSGFGYEHGSEGLFEYLKTKHIRVAYK